jgi:parallel beta-helix repeat protein
VNQALSNTIPAGNVMCQAPPAGTSVIVGSPVNLVVSLGPGGGPFHVDDDSPLDPGLGTAASPFRRIEDGLTNAANGDTVIVHDGTYTGTGNKNLDFHGKAITVRSENGAESTIIDCQNSGRGFLFTHDETASSVLEGFTITRGNVSGSDPGGGILCEASGPTISNCIITNNVAQNQGGGIYIGKGLYDVSDPTIINCTISNNRAGTQGGGICSAGPRETKPHRLTMTNCTITDNTAGSGTGGGACLLNTYLTVSGCTVTGNSAGRGGGLAPWGASGEIVDCTISGNTSLEGEKSGGGLWIAAGNVTLTNCIISGNRADFGGGIWFLSYELRDAFITNCTITGNRGATGGGLGSLSSMNIYVSNSIVWGNVAPQGHEIALIGSVEYPAVLAITYSDVQGGETDVPVQSGYTLNWGVGNIDADPLFVAAPLHDYYLSQTAAGQAADSPCVDTGSDTAASLGLNGFTTRTDAVADTGIVDMGYHTPASAMPGDVDGNMVVDGLDLTAVLNAWECVPGDPLWNPAADLDCNGVVNGLDLTAVISNWTTTGAAPASEAAPTATQAVKPGRSGAAPGNVRRRSGNLRQK